MSKFLSNVLKGLLTAFVIVVCGGVIALNIKTSPNNSMMLISSSVVNSLKTENKINKEEKVEEVELQEEVKEIEEKEEEKLEEKVQEPEPEPVVETKEPEPAPKVETKTPSANGSYSPNTDATQGASTNTFSGYMTAYGPDCYGCYGASTAMGDYVGEGNIYYNHPTYGNIRIVAGDRSILNKVVRISGVKLYSEPVIAIVRDTGGDIGFNKPKGIVLDLLFPSESTPEAANFGMQWVTVEVLN